MCLFFSSLCGMCGVHLLCILSVCVCDMRVCETFATCLFLGLVGWVGNQSRLAGSLEA